MSEKGWIIALVVSEVIWFLFATLLVSIIAKLRRQNYLAFKLCDKRMDAMKALDEMTAKYINDQNIPLAAKWREEAIRLNEESNAIVDELIASIKV